MNRGEGKETKQGVLVFSPASLDKEISDVHQKDKHPDQAHRYVEYRVVTHGKHYPTKRDKPQKYIASCKTILETRADLIPFGTMSDW